MNTRLYDLSAILAAEILNLHMGDQCKAQQFQRIQWTILDALIAADGRLRAEMLTPSNN